MAQQLSDPPQQSSAHTAQRDPAGQPGAIALSMA